MYALLLSENLGLRLNIIAEKVLRKGEVGLSHRIMYCSYLDYEKMFTDRVAVHLQKDVSDDNNGCLLNPRFIPDQHKEQWELFRAKHMHLNMYELVWNDLYKETELNDKKDLER